MGCGASKKYKEGESDTSKKKSTDAEAPVAKETQPVTVATDDPVPKKEETEPDGAVADDKPPTGATEDAEPKKEGLTEDAVASSGLRGVTALQAQDGGPKTPQAELESLFRDIRVGTTFGSLVGDELVEKKKRGKELMEEGVEPSPGALFYYKMNVDKNQNVDRMEFMQGISMLNYSSPDLDLKVSELFTNGDGAIILEEWVQICSELPDLCQAIAGSEICGEMKAHCKELLD